MPKLNTILVTGSGGQLGQSLTSLETTFPGYAFTFVNRADLDLSNEQSIHDFFQHHQFDLTNNLRDTEYRLEGIYLHSPSLHQH